MKNVDDGTSHEVLVLVAQDYRARMSEVAEALRTRGMSVQSMLEETGTITGSIGAGGLESLRGLPGVEAVEPGGTFQLPPPDSDLQ